MWINNHSIFNDVSVLDVSTGSLENAHNQEIWIFVIFVPVKHICWTDRGVKVMAYGYASDIKKMFCL